MSDITPRAGRAPVPPVTPEPPSKPARPTRPTAQGDRVPSMDTAKDILGDLRTRPADIPVPENPPPGYDRMSEIAKANSARVQAFSGGLPDDWEPVVADEPEITDEPAIVEATGDTN